MDYSSAPSYDQSLYQYQQPLYDQQQQQQQQQQLTYDPSQIQHYDSSTQQQSYYAYGQHYDQNYQYYAPPQGYATTANSFVPQSHTAYQQVNASASHMVQGEPKYYSQNPDNAYFAMHVPVPNHQQVGWSHLAPQYWENSSGGHQIGQSSYRRGGKPMKRGGGTFGRGRGQGGGKWFPRGAAMAANKASASSSGRGSGPAQPQPAAAAAAAAGQALLVPGSQVGAPAPPSWPPRRMAWCELCRVDCNTLEILEQHKNGKRHKKNLKMEEELQRLNKVVAGQEEADAQLLNSGTMVEAHPPEKVVVAADDSREKQLVENFKSEVVSGDRRDEAELPSDGAAAAATDARSCTPAGRGFKRKMRGRPGLPYGRSYKKFRRPVLPPQQRVPYICELCNVKSESQADFNLHLTGKRHLTKARHFLGPRCSSLGAAGVNPVSVAGPPGVDSYRPPLLDTCHPLFGADPQVQMLLSLMFEGLAQVAPTPMVPKLARCSTAILRPYHAPVIMPPQVGKSPATRPLELESDKLPAPTQPASEKSPVTMSPEPDKSPVSKLPESEKSPVTMLPDSEKSNVTMLPNSEISPVTKLSESEKSPVIKLPESEKSPVTMLPELEKSPVTMLPELEKSPVTMLPNLEKALVTLPSESDKFPVIMLPESEKSPVTTTELETCIVTMPSLQADNSPGEMKETGNSPSTLIELKKCPVTIAETCEAPLTKTDPCKAPVTMSELQTCPIEMQEAGKTPVTVTEMEQCPVEMEEAEKTPVTVTELEQCPVEMEDADNAAVMMTEPEPDKSTVMVPWTANHAVTLPTTQ